MSKFKKSSRDMKEKLIVIKLKHLYQDDPVDRLRGINVVNALQKKGWNIHLFNNQKNIDLIIFLDDYNLYDRLIYEYIEAKRSVVDIQDNHINRFNPVSQYMKNANQISLKQKLINESKKGILPFVLKVILKKLWSYFYKRSIKKADWVICSSQSLQNEYKYFNPNIISIPDAIEIQRLSKKIIKNKKTTICWIGTENNIIFLKIVNDALRYLQKKHGLDIHIICSENIFIDPILRKAVDEFSFTFTFTKWEASTVSESIRVDDIAIAPLPIGADKSTNKILTYMALGLPVVCSGANDYRSLYEENIDSFYFVENNNIQEWIRYLELLIEDERLRKTIGQQGRCLAERYSIDRIVTKYEVLFEKIFGLGTVNVQA